MRADVETHAEEEEVVRVRELAVLPEVLDDADDALVLPRGVGRLVGHLLHADDLSRRVVGSEKDARQPPVDHDRLQSVGVVLAREPAAVHELERDDLLEIVRDRVEVVRRFAAVGQLVTRCASSSCRTGPVLAAAADSTCGSSLAAATSC